MASGFCRAVQIDPPLSCVTAYQRVNVLTDGQVISRLMSTATILALTFQSIPSNAKNTTDIRIGDEVKKLIAVAGEPSSKEPAGGGNPVLGSQRWLYLTPEETIGYVVRDGKVRWIWSTERDKKR
jgi:hypothetical protein